MAPAETGEVMGSASLPAAELRPAAAYVTAGLAAPAPIHVAPAERASLRPRPRPVPQAAVPANAGAAPARPLSRPAPAPDRFTPSPVLPAALLAGLEARIQQAVQNAAVYPPSARMMHVEGRTRLRFDYTDGAVGMAGVVISSNSAVLDRAALDAVRRAELPRAPAEIGKRTLPLLVWVDFRLVRQD
jgi:protein TonB